MAAKDRISPDQLHLDLRNPRMPEQEFSNETSVLEHLVQNYDIEELILSIMSAGWLDFEPFIVLEESQTVLEGNRRLAALRLIRSVETRAMIGFQLPEVELSSGGYIGIDPRSTELTIPVRPVKTRQEAYVFLGFKHINGPYKWKALAKAKFASEWLEEGNADVDAVSRMLGDSHNTIVRLINGWRILKQAEEVGFDSKAISGYELAISHIYTALPRPAIRGFLGLTGRPTDLLDEAPVPDNHTKDLVELMTWIYGQEPKRQALVRRQNPDLNTLVRVIASEQARSELIATSDLARAEMSLTPPSDRFDVAVREAAKACENALSLVGGYDGSQLLFDIVNGSGKTVLNTRNRMDEIRAKDKEIDPLAAFGNESH